jgi:hypothetical protein
LDIRLLAFPALCDTYATYTTFALITRICDIRAPQAPQARIFPRLMQHSHATLASPIIHCHEEFTPLHPLDVTQSLEYHVRALPLFKRECSRASRAYSALFTRIDTSLSHCCSHLHISQAVVTIISPSCYCVCMHQSHFAQSAILPRFLAPTAPYASAFPALSAPSLHQSRLITIASDTLA